MFIKNDKRANIGRYRFPNHLFGKIDFKERFLKNQMHYWYFSCSLKIFSCKISSSSSSCHFCRRIRRNKISCLFRFPRRYAQQKTVFLCNRPFVPDTQNVSTKDLCSHFDSFQQILRWGNDVI